MILPGLLCYVFGKWIDMGDEDLDNLTISGFIFEGSVFVKSLLFKDADRLKGREGYTLCPRVRHCLICIDDGSDQEYNFEEVTLSEPGEINITHYKYLHLNPDFQHQLKQ